MNEKVSVAMGGGMMRGEAAGGGFVSGAIVRENARRFWPIGLVSLLVYFAMGPAPMLMRTPVTDMDYVYGGLTNYLLYSLAGIVFAVAGAVTVFRYLHSASALSVMHALPLTRRTLFFSNFLSGLLLLFAPFIINALIVLALIGTKGYAAVSVRSWLIWLAAVGITLFFTYAVSVFAGMVSGSTPVHLLVSAAFNFAWLLIYQLAVLQATSFLYGLSYGNEAVSSGVYLHPMSYFGTAIGDLNLSGDIVFTSFEVIPIAAGMFLYLLIAVIVSAVSYFAFLRFKAERAGRSLTSRAAEHVFVSVVTAAGMFFGAFILSQTNQADSGAADPMNAVSPSYLAGAVIGAAAAFIVATMILRRSARVFDLTALQRFGVFAAAAAVFMVFTMTNVTGFETRVPASADVSVGAFHAGAYFLPPYKCGMESLYGSWSVPVKDEEGKEALTALHRASLEDRAAIHDAVAKWEEIYEGDDGSGAPQDVGFAYVLKDGGREERGYAITGRYLRGSNEFARLLASDSVKSFLTIESILGYDALNAPEVSDGNVYNGETVSLDTDVRGKLTGEALKKLAACLDEDYLAMSANDMMHSGDELFTLLLTSDKPAGVTYADDYAAMAGRSRPLHEAGRNLTYSMYYTVTEKSERTIAYLKELGAFDSMVRTAEELQRRYEATIDKAEPVDPL